MSKIATTHLIETDRGIRIWQANIGLVGKPMPFGTIAEFIKFTEKMPSFYDFDHEAITWLTGQIQEGDATADIGILVLTSPTGEVTDIISRVADDQTVDNGLNGKTAYDVYDKT